MFRARPINREIARPASRWEGQADRAPARAPNFSEGQHQPLRPRFNRRFHLAHRRPRQVRVGAGGPAPRSRRRLLREDERTNGHDDRRDGQQHLRPDGEPAEPQTHERRQLGRRVGPDLVRRQSLGRRQRHRRLSPHPRSLHGNLHAAPVLRALPHLALPLRDAGPGGRALRQRPADPHPRRPRALQQSRHRVAAVARRPPLPTYSLAGRRRRRVVAGETARRCHVGRWDGAAHAAGDAGAEDGRQAPEGRGARGPGVVVG